MASCVRLPANACWIITVMVQLQCTMTQGPELDEERAATEMQFGGPRGAAGQWASCVRVIDPASASTTAVLELDENEVCCSCIFPWWS